VTGESSTGKLVALRIITRRLSALRNITISVIERSQSKSPDFYRELGNIFTVKLAPRNRWCGFKAVRERRKAHVASFQMCPVLLINEAQEMNPDVLLKLRILASATFDTTSLLTIILSGSSKLPEPLREEALIPLGSRIRTRLVTELGMGKELMKLLQHALSKEYLFDVKFEVTVCRLGVTILMCLAHIDPLRGQAVVSEQVTAQMAGATSRQDLRGPEMSEPLPRARRNHPATPAAYLNQPLCPPAPGRPKQ
jgi:hypothetical protein